MSPTPMVRCEKGHFYDTEKYRTCPYCEQQRNEKKKDNQDVTSTDILDGREEVDSVGDTTGVYGNWGVRPVVGWLVSIEGTTQGEDFRLCAGRNYIGRDDDMDVVLHDDKSVSRQKHAIVVFDPESQTTLCQAGESRELFYLNGKVVTDTVVLSKGDVLKIGKTKLMFVPFCGELFAWEEK